MTPQQLFHEHIETLAKRYAEATEVAGKAGARIDAVLIHSGSEAVYYADDQHIDFKAYAPFVQWVPVNRPDQMLLLRPGKAPVYYRVVPKDYWYDQTVPSEDWWAGRFEIVDLASPDEIADHLPPSRRIAFLGENTAFASQIGLPSLLHNETHLRNCLDYYRAFKTPYEVAWIRDANRLGVKGHEAARRAFGEERSEWEIHMTFLQACRMTESDSPYGNIVALDRNGAILHYQHKRRESGRGSRVLLIDAGCKLAGYCSDITRTYARPGSHPAFEAIVAGVDRLQLDLVKEVRAGRPYPDLHVEAHRRVSSILRETGIATGSEDEMQAQGISRLFFPHGIGHLLGIQVHDVGGQFKDATGELAPPPPEHKYLRLTRTMEPGMVFTIEPGIYFIPTLLDPERSSDKGKLLNWKLIDELTPLGGVRIEDNVLVTSNGAENLTR